MRTRNKEVKIRMNEKEFEHLNKMVEKSIFNRSDFIRNLLNGYEIQEKPTVQEIMLEKDLCNIASALHSLSSYGLMHNFTEKETQEIMALVKKSHKLEDILFEVYIPYYKIKKEKVNGSKNNKNK